MKQQEVFIKIGAILKELNEHYEYLQNNPDQLSDLELELFVANAHFLANNADVLTKLNSKTNAKAANPASEKYFEPLVHKPKPAPPAVEEQPAPEIDLAADTPTDTYSYIREEPEVIRHELEIDESWDDYEDITHETEKAETVKDELATEALGETKIETAVEDAPVTKEPIEAEPVFETKSTGKKEKAATADAEVLTINEKMSAQMANKAETGPAAISDLKAAITLNDKLLYVKDLFNGYSLAYSEAIELLNRFDSFEAADKFLQKNYSVKNKWDEKQVTSDKFYALLRRRYS